VENVPTTETCGTISDFVESALAGGMPGQLVSLAVVHIAQAFLRNGEHEQTENVLGRMYGTVAKCACDANKDEPVNAIDVAGLFLDAYFSHKGDWRAMSKHLRERMEAGHPERAAFIDSVIAAAENMVQRSCARFGHARREGDRLN
jgi:hypothetical protein